jgi:hypothetical protein
MNNGLTIPGQTGAGLNVTGPEKGKIGPMIYGTLGVDSDTHQWALVYWVCE